MSRFYIYGGAIMALLLAGLALGWYLYRPAPPKPETYAPAVVQEDKSLILERTPRAAAKPAQKVPQGAKVERVIKVIVEPDKGPVTDAGGKAKCPDLDVDLTLVRLPDESRRVIASSPDGKIVGGLDIPVESAKVYKELKWAAGVTANPLDHTFGAFVDRDLGPFRVGAEANQIRNGYDARVKLGVRF